MSSWHRELPGMRLFSSSFQRRICSAISLPGLRQPRVFGHVAPALSNAIFPGGSAEGTISLKYDAVVGFLYTLGPLLLMFACGAETKGLFRREDRREVGWLGGVGGESAMTSYPERGLP